MSLKNLWLLATGTLAMIGNAQEVTPAIKLSNNPTAVIARGDVDALERLLDKGLSPNARIDDTQPLLHAAVKAGKGELVRLLLKRGAKVEAKDTHPLSGGGTALHVAASEGNPEIAKLLLNYEADVFSEGTGLFAGEPICTAIRSISNLTGAKDKNTIKKRLASRKELVSLLLDQDRNRKVKCAPLHVAAGEGDLEMVKLLIDSGWDVNSTDVTKRELPIHKAVGVRIVYSESGKDEKQPKLLTAYRAGNAEVVAYLIEAKADLNAQGITFLTPAKVAEDVLMGLKKEAAKTSPALFTKEQYLNMISKQEKVVELLRVRQ